MRWCILVAYVAWYSSSCHAQSVVTNSRESNGLTYWHGRTDAVVHVTSMHDSTMEGLVKSVSFLNDSSHIVKSIYYGCYVDGKQVSFDVVITPDEVRAEISCLNEFDYSMSSYFLTHRGKPTRIVERDANGNRLAIRRYSAVQRLFCKRIKSVEYFHLYQVLYWDAFVSTSPVLLYWAEELIPGDVERPRWVRKTRSAGTLPRCLFKG